MLNHNDQISAIASTHLGKAGDGTIVKPYVTPDKVDANLLVGIPRVLNRTQYDIRDEELPFHGFDTWHAYEFSTLKNNGLPISGTLKISYPANSSNIVESKSLKLYLNSFNMMNCGATVDDVIDFVECTITNDLRKVLGLVDDDVEVYLHEQGEGAVTLPPVMGGAYNVLELVVDDTDMVFDRYNEDPAILDVVHHDQSNTWTWSSALLRSNCRVTNQPDWGDIFIKIEGTKTVTPESLLQYIVSMRRENHFHEEICECVYKRLFDLLEPTDLVVTCLYTRRGGIDINPSRSMKSVESSTANLKAVTRLTEKTMKQ